jgi:hypothetical protein
MFLRRTNRAVIGKPIQPRGDQPTLLIGTLSSPAVRVALAGNTHNCDPGPAWQLQLTADRIGGLSGLVAGVDGQTMFLWNTGINRIIITHEDHNSAPENRFRTTTGGMLPLQKDHCALAMYDQAAMRWRVSLLP